MGLTVECSVLKLNVARKFLSTHNHFSMVDHRDKTKGKKFLWNLLCV